MVYVTGAMLCLLLVMGTCLLAGVSGYSDGAPKMACGDLTPQHGAQLQTKTPPYSFSETSHFNGNQNLTLTLSGEKFLGFMIQARDGQNRVVGQFKVVDMEHSQTLDCSGPQDTLTHLKINKDNPLNGVKFDWIPPRGYKGNVKFMATVVQSSFVYWVGRVTKDVHVD